MTGHPESEEGGGAAESPTDGGASPDMHTLSTARHLHQPLIQHLQNAEADSEISCIESEYALPVPMAPSATPVQVSTISMDPQDPVSHHQGPTHGNNHSEDAKDKFETLRSLDQKVTLDMDRHMNQQNSNRKIHPTMMITSEFLGLIPGEQDVSNEGLGGEECNEDGLGIGGLMAHGLGSGPKTWSQQDMENALDALRNHNMSLTKASATFGIPSTTLWQRAHRLGIDTPKKEGPSKSWSESNLHNALQALRTGTISANKASKAYGIPSSTLYKIARREGIRLAAPFNAAPTAWRPGDLERALHSIRSGHSSVQRASTEFGIPTGTLYGRCKREGIELSRSNPTPWSEDAMGEALEAVRIGQMSINQAAIHYNLPYSSLYGRFKRCKYEGDISGGLEPVVQIQGHVSQGQEQHHSQQQPAVSAHNHIPSHVLSPDLSRHHMYAVYNHPLSLPMPVHEHPDVSITHNNQDCIPIS